MLMEDRSADTSSHRDISGHIISLWGRICCIGGRRRIYPESFQHSDLSRCAQTQRGLGRLLGLLFYTALFLIGKDNAIYFPYCEELEADVSAELMRH